MTSMFKRKKLIAALFPSVTLITPLLLGSSVASYSADNNLEEVVVVGARGQPRSVTDSPVAVDVIGGDDLAQSGSTDMLELLKNAAPSLNVHTQPISDAATLVRPINLRGLPSDSTLVLLNGKRRHRSSVIVFLGGGLNDGAQGPDISVIPSIALKKVEILRDGAAAQYGSDAIAGVINFVLKDDASGGTFEARQSEYFEGDGTATQYAGNIGLPLTDNGFVNLSFQFKNVDATSRSEQRPDAAALIANGNSSVSSLAQIWGSPEINDDISFFFNAGLELSDDNKLYMNGNISERDVRGGFYFRNPHTRPGVYSNDDGATLLVGDLTPGPLGQVNEGLADGDGIDCPVVNITTENVLTQADYALVANDPNCFAFNEMIPGGFTPNFGGNVKDSSLAVGIKGEFRSGALNELSYDLSATTGRNASDYVIYNTINASLGADSPRDFKPGKYIQTEKNINLDLVKPFEAGFVEPLSVAGGLEWREESFEVFAGDQQSYEVGPLTSQGFGIGSNGFPGFQPSAVGNFSQSNYAAYVDVEAQYTDDFMMGYALRYENFNTFGSTTNYKVTTHWQMTEQLALRGSLGSGFRAPTVGQSNVSNVQTNLSDGVLRDSALLPPTNPISEQLGGTELQPEESDSRTLGLVFNQDDFTLTLDLYEIKVTDRISQSEKIVLSDADKDVLREAGVPNVDSIAQVSFFTNDFDTTTRGADLVANYSSNLFGGSTNISFAYNWNKTKVDNFSEITGDFKVKRLEEDLPNHRATLSLSQDWEDFSALIRANYYGKYQGVHVDYDLTAKEADPVTTFDFELSYSINDRFRLTAGGQNILDAEAEKIDFEGDSNTWGGIYYETSPMGFNGGLWYAKLTYSYQ